MSYASAETLAAEYPQYSTQITAAAKESFLAGDEYAYIAGIIAIVLGAVLIFLKYPKKDEEQQVGGYVPRRGYGGHGRGGQSGACAGRRNRVQVSRRVAGGRLQVGSRKTSATCHLQPAT